MTNEEKLALVQQGITLAGQVLSTIKEVKAKDAQVTASVETKNKYEEYAAIASLVLQLLPGTIQILIQIATILRGAFDENAKATTIDELIALNEKLKALPDLEIAHD